MRQRRGRRFAQSHKPTVGRGLKASKVGTIKRSDGKSQVTYNGHPLYRFVNDKKPGDTNGQGITAFGGRWFVLSPAGKRVSARAVELGRRWGLLAASALARRGGGHRAVRRGPTAAGTMIGSR